jgi:hypothetical protein
MPPTSEVSMTFRRWLAAVCAAVLVIGTAVPVWAFSSGISSNVFGATGCPLCHGGGLVPTVVLSGPTLVAPGSTNVYTLEVFEIGAQPLAGLNAAASDGTFTLGGPDSAQTKLILNAMTARDEITHTSPKLNSGGVTTFSFQWTAPLSFASVGMTAWGNAVTGTLGAAGDMAASDALTIDSTDPVTPTPTASTTPTPTSTPSPTVTPAGEHFTCYKSGATSGTEKFPGIAIPPGIDLTDQFGFSNLNLKKTKYLCPPTNKNGEDPTAPAHPEHLKSYQIKNPLKPAPLFPQNIEIVDQFNPNGLIVKAKKQQLLLVPAVKSLTGPTPVPTPGAFSIDHFECYNVSVVSGTPKFVQVLGVTLEDQFGAMTVDVKKPKYLCNPVNKNGEDPTAPTHLQHRMCYQIKQTDLVPFVKITGIFVNDQFGPETVDAKKPQLLCVPALKTP